MIVEVYSDVACPWCYLGKHRFDQALAEYRQSPQAVPVEVVYRPFQLQPDAEHRPVPHGEMIREKFGPQGPAMDARLEETAHAEGLPLDFSRAVENNTLDAHRLLRHALVEHGAQAQAAVKARMLTARFAEGADLGDHDTLVALAADAGLDGERARRYLASDQGRAEVLDEIEQAHRVGVSAVPTFVFEHRWAVQGAQPAQAMLDLLIEVAQQATSASASPAAEAP